ncbi:S-adenosyl-L-methionine-dependent methyltransferase [Geopyxis carbonaria]|nr:S-adenosyl-L-methionine-dependent methyltransferase [Geopyxis carbonaria]
MDNQLWIEADSDFEEVRSQYDSCYSCSDNTTTIASEVTNYKFENGRRYHAYSEGQYWGPNDDQQNNQLEIFHQVFTLVLGGLFQAPIQNPQNVLDLGTGTGIWAIEMADLFPNAEVLGNDLSPVQPTWIPANCTFEVDDFTKPWLHKPQTFDFIHARSLHGCCSSWSSLVSEVYKTLIPGGWFENVETTVNFYNDSLPGGDLPTDSALNRWCTLTRQAGERCGRPFDSVLSMSKVLKDHGFTNVNETVYKVPVGPWPKEKRLKTIGKYNLVNILEASEGFCLALFTRHLGWTAAKARELIAEVMEELRMLRDSRQELYIKMHVVYGQRPESDQPLDGEIDVDSAYWSEPL